MEKLPEKLKIAGLTYQVMAVDNLMATYHKYGETDFVSHTIRYDPASHQESKEETILHESIHAIIDVLDGEGIIDARSESFVRPFSRLLYMFLTENNLGFK